MDFQQSKTFSNLLKSYESELISTTYYMLNADQSRLEGYIEIGNIFDVTAKNEKEHARIWQRSLNSGTLPKTEQNLIDSADREVAVAQMYRDYAKIANEEGYSEIAALFNGIANIELNHDLRFRSLYSEVVTDQVFCKPDTTLWICMQCGNIMSGKCAPDICPVCGFPQGYYRLYTSADINP